MKNRTMMQGFHWDIENNGEHWNNLKKQAHDLEKHGINMIWMPPAYKGQNAGDVGYGVYDMYDLGEFDQKYTVRTKYGTKDEYLAAIQSLHEHHIEVISDIVMNHRMGADEMETVPAYTRYNDNRDYQKEGLKEIGAWTKFTFPGRKGKYSTFQFDHHCFTGVDYDGKADQNGIYLFEGKGWANDVDSENHNYDYLMGADLDLHEECVWNELVNWGKWYLDLTQSDGFRLDAIKHMSAPFYDGWVNEMRKYANKELFTVGEYWSNDLNSLKRYIHQTNGQFSLFDVPLHMHLYQASTSGGNYDMGSLLEGTLTKDDSWHSVTFVDNHDTQPGQALVSFIEPWFKPIAYGIILLQEKGIPCVFYGDYYGIDYKGNDLGEGAYHVEKTKHLKKLLTLRQTHAYGKQHDYYDHHNVIGFTREGENENQGLAMICSDGPGGTKHMYIGTQHKNEVFEDALKNVSGQVVIGNDGCGDFYCDGGSISVWVKVDTLNWKQMIFHHVRRMIRHFFSK